MSLDAQYDFPMKHLETWKKVWKLKDGFNGLYKFSLYELSEGS